MLDIHEPIAKFPQATQGALDDALKTSGHGPKCWGVLNHALQETSARQEEIIEAAFFWSLSNTHEDTFTGLTSLLCAGYSNAGSKEEFELCFALEAGLLQASPSLWCQFYYALVIVLQCSRVELISRIRNQPLSDEEPLENWHCGDNYSDEYSEVPENSYRELADGLDETIAATRQRVAENLKSYPHHLHLPTWSNLLTGVSFITLYPLRNELSSWCKTVAKLPEDRIELLEDSSDAFSAYAELQEATDAALGLRAPERVLQ